MKVTVNQNSCIGCGMCVGMCSDVFEYDSSLSAAKTNEISDENIQLVKDAAEVCPVGAIEIVEE